MKIKGQPTFPGFLEWLIRKLASPREFQRKRKSFWAVFCCDSLILANGEGRIGVLKIDKLRKIFQHWEHLLETERWKPSRYNAPAWSKSPDMNYAPLVPPLICKFLEYSNKNK
jgi:hypothetical protein